MLSDQLAKWGREMLSPAVAIVETLYSTGWNGTPVFVRVDEGIHEERVINIFPRGRGDELAQASSGPFRNVAYDRPKRGVKS